VEPRPEPTETALELDPEERDFVAAEIEALLPALAGSRREAFAALKAAVAEGRVPAALVPALEEVVGLALETGRARALYLAEGERVLTGLLRKTPAGERIDQELARVNRALRALQGATLWSVRVGLRTLGKFTLELETDRAAVTLLVRSRGVTVESLEPRGAVGGAPEGSSSRRP
jgi:hypothetical protein